MKYIYPAIFTPDDGGYSVEFPDIEGCYTCGKDLQDSISMAEDALPLMLTVYEDEKRKIPVPSDIRNLKLDNGQFASYISCDTDQYRRLL